MPTSQVTSAWRRAHQVEVDAWASASPAEVTARLAAIEIDLHQQHDPASTELAKRIDAELRSPGAGAVAAGAPAGAPPSPTRVQLLREALRRQYGARDTTFEDLADLQTKAMWLAVLGLVLIAIANAAWHHPALFLFGAVGAFVSRLSAVFTATPDNDYGASAGRLFVSPVAGAIAGWTGVLVVTSLANPHVHLVGATFRGLWHTPVTILAATVAVVFGFSERLLNRMLAKAEQAIAG